MQRVKSWVMAGLLGAALLSGCVAFASAAKAAPVEKPTANKQVRFPVGTWAAVPQVGPNGKVRQCVMVAFRARQNSGGADAGDDGIETRFSINISTGAGLAIAILDDKLPSAEDVLDDQAEVIVGDRSFPAVAFTVANSNSLASHPVDAAGVLRALAKAKTVRVRADGAGVDTGPIDLNLPADALAWLIQCGKTFNIAVDRPTDPDAPAMPAPRPRSPEIAPAVPSAAGPPGIDDKQKIAGWDASELRSADGRIAVCYIRQRYSLVTDMTKPPDANAPIFINSLMASRTMGLTMMLKNTGLRQPEGAPVEATLAIEGKPFTALKVHMLGRDEIGLFPAHGKDLNQALGDGVTFAFKSPIYGLDYAIPPGVVPWLRACARRNGISFEAPAQR